MAQARIEGHEKETPPARHSAGGPRAFAGSTTYLGHGLRGTVLLHDGGFQRAPLFLVHDAYGDLLLYRQLAKAVGDRRVFGILPSLLPSGHLAHTRIESMAEHYVRLVRGLHPDGPFLLGGLCAGAVVAAEMALQLERKHEAVALVAVLDAADVSARRKHEPASSRAPAPVRALSRVWAEARAPGGLGEALRAAAERRLDRWLQAAAFVVQDRLGFCPARLGRHLDTRNTYGQAERRYRPSGTVEGPIFLMRASAGTAHDQPYRELYVDDTLGWRARAAGLLAVVDVPGGHVSLLEAPAVTAVGAAVREACERATEMLAPHADELAAQWPARGAPASVDSSTGSETRKLAPGPSSSSRSSPW